MDKRFWVVVPAAGSARRMGAAVPKQYLPLAGRTVIEWSLAPFLAHARTVAIVVVLAEQDQRWPQIAIAGDAKIATAIGGAERMDSVLAGLRALQDRAAPDDWVLVHDAARPCLSAGDLDRLLNELSNDDVGGLLAAPVVDTLKRADDGGRVLQTVPREKLWRALTPQMFRRDLLQRALQSAQAKGLAVTDEAQAIEALGLQPKLVAGDSDNVKITLPEDLPRAERILISRSAT
ncbi:2-C-methyl-D-erythritol 4-phosphate cytidylyltransferase [Steroidobacter agaridevorans]|uniref:2-C-methyl-D-erythritol 4-phosphate cytidylyltransferase n=2 Tax=Steroidobacter agaridevorans TaxID=2695856 RepID=A0A829YBW6_9GAMM|nr:2-C-methyl-D-erythritol 4-phosphate cytidylyltransferase [Steroidobacter agaridevorans]GFE80777.1 2-C-methyl-D-erythritol 4-phosphate cytidylyltransferase [Steroidobacter agaridevorans]